MWEPYMSRNERGSLSRTLWENFKKKVPKIPMKSAAASLGAEGGRHGGTTIGKKT